MLRLGISDMRMVKVTCGGRTSSSPGRTWQSFRFLSTKTAGGKGVNHYKILGVASDCNQKELKQAYYRLSKVYHPDVNKSETASQQFQIISQAYEVLSNDLTRRQYDIEQGIIRGDRPLRHGQQKYRPRGTPPTGMSSTYNFDEWYKKHYSETFNRGMDDKRKAAAYEEYLREEMKHAYKSNDNEMSDQLYSSGATKNLFMLVTCVTIVYVLKRIIKPK